MNMSLDIVNVDAKSPQHLLGKLFNMIEELGINGCFVVVPAIAMHEEDLLRYWGALEYRNTLRFRFADMYEPTAREILALVVASGHKGSPGQFFNVIDCDTNMIVADLGLTDFVGEAAQLHYSMHPDNEYQLNMFLADAVSDMVLYNWTKTIEMKEPYIQTLYGITSVKNRVACMFIAKANFERVGIVPNIAEYQGETTDAVISHKTRH